ncbi:MAG: MBL fold metallo-hydrolase [Thermoplasmata archaeon]|nr:MAG: MBL fold metallo-hydrolase [Thermoplasmata archaeon]
MAKKDIGTYAGLWETQIFKKRSKSSSKVTTVLHGSYMKILDDSYKNWYKVKTFGLTGWVPIKDTRKDEGFKAFFIDVGQGDSCLIEIPDKALLIDGGRNSNVHRYLTKWKYRWLLDKGYDVEMDAIVVSHFDFDHFGGLTSLIKHPRFKIGTIYHNGIARFKRSQKDRPAKYDEQLGTTDAKGKPRIKPTILKTSFSTINDAKKLLEEDKRNHCLMPKFRDFLKAVVEAKNQNRLKKLERLTIDEKDLNKKFKYLTGFTSKNKLQIEVIGPVVKGKGKNLKYNWFEDYSHTVNGNSVVVVVRYKDIELLLGGDLNIPSENHLIESYKPKNPFRVDVAKACHHGASEFTIEFMKKVSPYATVISSGDNESYAHPRADSLGCAGRYSRGNRPKVFSTELARSYKSPDEIHYGLINMRSDGNNALLAQMFEAKRVKDMWDSYKIKR